MATIWFTSDSHFHHANFLTFKDKKGDFIRPFSCVEEVDTLMEERWKEVVKPQDHIYHLGDLTMERGSRGGPQAQRLIKLIKGLPGHKRLVLGNHDHFSVSVYQEAGFEKIRGCYGGFEGLVLTHIPVHPDTLWNKVNVHGHIHERLVRIPEGGKPFHERKPDPKYVNVCVEQTLYRPISLEEIMERIK